MAVAVALPRDARLDLLEEFTGQLAHLNYAASTVASYRSAAQRLLAAHPGLALADFTPEHVEQYLTAKGLSPVTFSTALENLRSFFRFLVKRKHIAANPCAGIAKPKVHLRTRPAPSEADVEMLLQACTTLEEQVLVETFFRTGLRISELRSLRLRDVDMDKRLIHVIGKGSKERVALFPPRTRSLLQLFTAGREPEDWLFIGRRGHPRYSGTLQKMLHRIGERAHLPYRLTAHLFRHGFIKHCKTHDVPVEVTARLVGHGDMRTTVNHYGRLDTGDLQAIYDKKLGGMEGAPSGNGHGNHADLAIGAVRGHLQEVICLTPQEAEAHLALFRAQGMTASIQPVTLYRVQPTAQGTLTDPAPEICRDRPDAGYSRASSPSWSPLPAVPIQRTCAARNCSHAIPPNRDRYCSAECEAREKNRRDAEYNRAYRRTSRTVRVYPPGVTNGRICAAEGCTNPVPPPAMRRFCSLTCKRRQENDHRKRMRPRVQRNGEVRHGRGTAASL